MLPISVCIIAKNEESRIQTCLESLAPYQFEIIIVDTGSTDSTKLIANGYTEHVYDFQWVNDFSAARNFSISKASNDWIFIVDCDDILEEFHLAELEDYMKNHKRNVGTITYKNETKDPNQELTYAYCQVDRFFHRDYFYYDSPIHEQVVPKNANSDYGNSLPLPITLLHTGYNGSDYDTHMKAQRNIAILKVAIQNEPNNSYHFFQLGRDLITILDFEGAKECFETALSLGCNPNLIHTKMLYINYGELFRDEGNFDKGIALLEGAKEILNDYADAAYLLGTLYYNKNDALNSILSYMKALNCTTYTNEACKNYLPHYMLGLIYEQLSNPQLAISFYDNCLTYKDAKERRDRLKES